MKFEICRTSDYEDSKQPHPKAYKVNDDWYINIDSLENLIQLCKDVENNGIDQFGIIMSSKKIEIYDGFRE